MTRRRGLAAEDDPALAELVACQAPVCTLVGKTWALHLDKVTKASPDENLGMITDSVCFLAAHGKRVVYDAEHFFDAWREDSGYALECLRAGGRRRERNPLRDKRLQPPAELAQATAEVVEALGLRTEVCIHTHNDAECAVANSLAAVEAGRAGRRGP